MLSLAAAVLLILTALIPGILASLVFAFYMLFCSLCYAIQGYADMQSESRNPLNWVFAALYLILCLYLVAERHDDSRILQIVIGWYLIFQGLQLLAVHSFARRQRSWGYRLVNHMTALPVSFVTFLPFLVLELLQRRQKKTGSLGYDSRKSAQKTDLTVYIHTGTEGAHIVGHMTFAFDGLMYSYGNYAKKEEQLHGVLGKAIFFTAPPEIYINNSCIYEGSTLYGFGLVLDDQQKQNLKKMLQEMTLGMDPWQCPLQQDPEGWKHPEKYMTDYSCRLFWRTGAKFHQFRHGRWKTYWVMGTNCSLFAENVLTAAGCRIPRKQGIVSPGEYFQYFEELFADPGSQVISRSVFTAEVPASLYPTWA